MGDRGRKSAAALSIIPAESSFRPKAPDHLTPLQADEWAVFVARLPPARSSRETHGLLTAYVRHFANAQLVAEQLTAFESEWLHGADGLERFATLSRLLE